MLSYLAACLILGLAVAAPRYPKTRPVPTHLPDPQIIGGGPVAITAHPHQVSVQTKAGSHTCGASIITSTKLVCAAHCTQNSPDSYQIRAGSATYDSGGVTREVSAIVNHPSYSPTGVYPNDISTIRLDRFLLFSSSVNSISMATSGTYVASTATITGWGRTGTSTILPTDLQGVNMMVIANLDCSSRTGAAIRPEQICVFTNGNEGACNGDSGGPARVGGELVGIASWVISSGGNCDTSYPSVYTRVSSYYSWVNNN